ncbi:MAG: hypothetical protein O7D30_01420 [Rickettsia endosymbiont of Ixodes persulcatus]|nr:hypothetical protein [Rickettsia endosymbiont of Ixodes persulcatus]
MSIFIHITTSICNKRVIKTKKNIKVLQVIAVKGNEVKKFKCHPKNNEKQANAR